MEFTSDSHGINMEFTSDSHRTHIGFAWNSHRTHMEFTSDSHITHIGFIAREFGAIFLSVFLACHRPHIGRPRSCAPVQNWTGAQGLVQRWTGAQDLGQLFLYNMKADPAHRRSRRRSSSRKSSVRLAQRQKHDGPLLHPPLRLARTHERTNDSPVSNRSLRKLRLTFLQPSITS